MATSRQQQSNDSHPWFWTSAVALMASVFVGCGSDVVFKGPYMRGVDRFDDGDYPGAISEYQVALGENPDDHRIHYNLGLCFHDMYLAAGKDEEKASVYFERAQAAYRKSSSLTENKARAQIAESKLIWDSGDHEQAIQMLKNVVGDDGTGMALPSWTRGTMLLTENRQEEAIRAFQESLVADEGYLPAMTALADLHLLRGELDEADVMSKKGLKKAPHDVTLLILNAKIASMAARSQKDPGEKELAWEESLARWRTAEALVPTDWEVLLGIATAAEALGEQKLAVRYFWFTEDNASDFALKKRGVDPAAFREDLKQRLLKLYPVLGRDG